MPWGTVGAAIGIAAVGRLQPGLGLAPSAARGARRPPTSASAFWCSPWWRWWTTASSSASSIAFYLFNIALLLALKFIGHKAKGAESWFVVGPLRIQPAEFMKIGMVLMLARYFHDDYRPGKEGHYGVLRLVPPLVLAMVPTVLVLVQPDLGTALMMVFTTATLLLFARVQVDGVAHAAWWWRWSRLGVLWNDYVRRAARAALHPHSPEAEAAPGQAHQRLARAAPAT